LPLPRRARTVHPATHWARAWAIAPIWAHVFKLLALFRGEDCLALRPGVFHNGADLLTLAIGQVQVGKGFWARPASWATGPAGATALFHAFAAKLLALFWGEVGKFLTAALHLGAAGFHLLALFCRQHGLNLAAAVFSNGLQLLALGLRQIQTLHWARTGPTHAARRIGDRR
jgi:hypothetical protein